MPQIYSASAPSAVGTGGQLPLAAPDEHPGYTVWLIDDDAFANFCTERLIRQGRFARQVRTLTSVPEALQLLADVGPAAYPDVILLDLNLPQISGWTFLMAYAQLPAASKACTAIYLLSGSEDPADFYRARSFPEVRSFIAKPLSLNDLDMIRQECRGLGLPQQMAS